MRSTSNQFELSHETLLEAAGVNLYFLDRILHAIDTRLTGRFVDIGCGTGILAKCLADASGFQPYGTEISASACSIASARINCSLVQGVELPFEDGFFTLAIAKDVIPSISEKKKWFQEIIRVLDIGGIFISYLPDENDFAQKPLFKFIEGSEDCSKNAYGLPRDIFESMTDAGFNKLHCERIFLGNVQMGSSYFMKHKSGYFNNTLGEDFDEPRRRGLTKASKGIASLNGAGIIAHYEWERNLVIGKKI